MQTLKQLMNLKGRTALITGGAGHLGFVTAATLAEMGSKIILLDVNKDLCVQKIRELQRKYHIKAFPCVVDLAKEQDVRGVSDIVKKYFGSLDILVNCAALVGTSHLKGWAVPFKQQNLDTWRLALEINLTSIFLLVQSCRNLLLQSKHSSIINISSIYGMVGPDLSLYEDTGLGNPAAYAASKGGLLQLTRWLATSLAPQTRVNAISLGGVFRNHKQPFLARYKNRTPLKRMAQEEDLKGAVAYLASDLSNYVTGHNLVVDGGWTAW